MTPEMTSMGARGFRAPGRPRGGPPGFFGGPPRGGQANPKFPLWGPTTKPPGGEGGGGGGILPTQKATPGGGPGGGKKGLEASFTPTHPRGGQKKGGGLGGRGPGGPWVFGRFVWGGGRAFNCREPGGANKKGGTGGPLYRF